MNFDLPREYNLMMTNFWIGICKGVYGLPRDFCREKYEVIAVETPIFMRSGGVNFGDVKPEVLLGSLRNSHCLAFEFKSGPNIEPDQAARYTFLGAEHLQSKGFCESWPRFDVEVVYVGMDQHQQRLQMGLTGLSFPLLLSSTNGLAYGTSSTLQQPALNTLFTNGLDVDWTSVPRMFYSIDPDSTDLDVLEYAVPELLNAWRDGYDAIGIEDVCRALCKEWRILGAETRKNLTKKVSDLFFEVQRAGQFRKILRYTKGNMTATFKKSRQAITLRQRDYFEKLFNYAYAKVLHDYGGEIDLDPYEKGLRYKTADKQEIEELLDDLDIDFTGLEDTDS